MLDRVLVVGLGSIGRRHARVVRTLLPAARIGAWRHGGPSEPSPPVDCVMTTVDDALKFGPQAAVIANPATRHLDAALPLARAGVHLLIEKPISHNVEGVAELIEISARHKTTVMTGYNLRFSASLQAFRDLVRSGRIGRVMSVRAEVGQFLPSWRPDADYRATVTAQAALGGGVLLELSHEIDYLRWLFGDVEWVSAVVRKQSDLEMDAEDTAHLVLGFAPFAEHAPVLASVTMDCVRHDTTRTCTAIGATGSLRWTAAGGVVEVFERGASQWQTVQTFPQERDDTFLAEWRDFLACIEQGRAPQITARDGLEALRVVDAARESSASGSVVSLV